VKGGNQIVDIIKFIKSLLPLPFPNPESFRDSLEKRSSTLGLRLEEGKGEILLNPIIHLYPRQDASAFSFFWRV
jgi:hypothetical protein